MDDIETMCRTLEGFSKAVESTLGAVEISNRGERFCLKLPPQASEYVHNHTEQTGFLYDFIHAVSKHGVSMEEILEQFYHYSNCVHVEKTITRIWDWKRSEKK